MENDSEAPNAWLIDPIGEYINYLAAEIALSTVAERGITALTGLPTYLAVTKRYLQNAGEVEALQALETLIHMARDQKRLAEDEVHRGFPQLFAHSTVSIWAATETTIEDLLANHLYTLEDGLDRVHVRYPKIRIPSQQKRSEPEALRQFVGLWEKSLNKADVIDRYQAMLAVFELDVELDAATRQDLTELAEGRNVILHRKSTVDQRFLGKCPWFRGKLGEHYKIDRNRYLQFYDAANKFAVALMKRACMSPWFSSKPD